MFVWGVVGRIVRSVVKVVLRASHLLLRSLLPPLVLLLRSMDGGGTGQHSRDSGVEIQPGDFGGTRVLCKTATRLAKQTRPYEVSDEGFIGDEGWAPACCGQVDGCEGQWRLQSSGVFLGGRGAGRRRMGRGSRWPVLMHRQGRINKTNELNPVAHSNARELYLEVVDDHWK